jgi:hypothetical protein
MAFFTGWAEKLGDALVGLFPGAHAVLMRKSDDSLDMLTSDGAGAALVSAVGGATEAKQDAIATALADSHPRNVARVPLDDDGKRPTGSAPRSS